MNAPAPIRVLLVDDSPFVCRLLTAHLHAQPGFEVVGTALNGRRGVALTTQLRPDVITLDLEMPEMDGLTALRRIMAVQPTPVVMISGVSRRAAQVTMDALDSGAVDFVLKYAPGEDVNTDALRHEIVSKVRAAAGIRVVRSVAARPSMPTAAHPTGKRPLLNGGTAGPPEPDSGFWSGRVLVIGASTGGPVAVRGLLQQLPADFGAAVIVVQHMPAAFTAVFAAQLDRRIELPVAEAADGDRLRPGRVLVAPGDRHLLLRPTGRVQLTTGPKINGHRPAIDVTMQSAVQVCGPRAGGVVLTGMGQDGALGLVAVHSKGGPTFAQNAESCVVNGMPQRAIERGVVDTVGTPEQIAAAVRQWLTVNNHRLSVNG